MQTRDPILHIIATCAAQIGAISTPIISPLIIGGLIVGLGVGELEAGSLITIELLVIGITSLILAPLMVRIPHHLLAIAGASVLIMGHALSTQASEMSELFPWRILAGIGSGCLVATVNAAIARARSPVQLYGLAWAAVYTVTAILAVLMTETNDVVTYDIVYGWLAAALLLFLPLLWFIPGHGGETTSIPFPRDSIGTGCILMLCIMIIGISMMAYYAFLERLAVLIGASPVQTGRIIAAAQIAGIVGGLSAAPVANRFGLIPALVSIACLHVAAIAVAIWTDQVIVLAVAAFIEALLFIIMMPLMMTLAANIDKKGRWAAAAGGVFILSTALGPVTGAALIEVTGYAAIAWLQLLAALPAIYIFIRVNRMTVINK